MKLHLELIRPLFYDIEDLDAFCVSNLKVECPAGLEPEDPDEFDDWAPMFEWVADEFPGWLPKNYQWLENE